MSRDAQARHGSRLVLWIVIVCVAVLLGIRTYYPLDHISLISRSADEFGLEPALVSSVIRSESSFRPHVVSSAGAIGLMQILPTTGAWIATHLGLEPFDDELLFEPEINIRVGCWYLRYLMDRFGDQTVALMAYNAGPSRVEAWDQRLELAFPETQAYVARIERTRPIYSIYFEVPWLVDLIPSLRF